MENPFTRALFVFSPVTALTVSLSLSSIRSKCKLSIYSRTSHLLVKWDVKPKMWVMSLIVHCPQLWHLIQKPVQPQLLSRPCHLYRPQYTSHPCNYFTGFFCAAPHAGPPAPLPPLCHAGLLPKAHRAVTSAVFQWPQPRGTCPPSSLCLLSHSILPFHSLGGNILFR